MVFTLKKKREKGVHYFSKELNSDLRCCKLSAAECHEFFVLP